MKYLNKRKFFVVIAICIMLSLLGFMSFHKKGESKSSLITSSDSTHDISVVFINAGRADSILVQADGNSWLIDTGLKDSVDNIEAVLEKYQVQNLEGVFLTHTHKDHVGGFKELSKDYNIGKLYSAEISMNEDDGENKIDNLAEETGLSQVKLSAGDKVEAAEDIYFEVLGPLTYNGDDDNDNSLVLRMYVNGKVFLFAGDMQFSEESTLLNENYNLSADILKVGNHGNPDATSESFAKAVSPEAAIITTDRTEDTDSANESVVSLFDNTYITDEYQYGILVTVDKNGVINIGDA